MEDAKRYEIDGLKAYIDCKDPKFKLKDFESWDGDICFYSDHKAVVESKDDELNIVKAQNVALKNQIETMQNKIDELEKDRLEMAVLSQSEWITIIQNTKSGQIHDAYCKECGRTLGLGHKENCTLNEKLEKANQIIEDSKGD